MRFNVKVFCTKSDTRKHKSFQMQPLTLWCDVSDAQYHYEWSRVVLDNQNTIHHRRQNGNSRHKSNYEPTNRTLSAVFIHCRVPWHLNAVSHFNVLLNCKMNNYEPCNLHQTLHLLHLL